MYVLIQYIKKLLQATPFALVLIVALAAGVRAQSHVSAPLTQPNTTGAYYSPSQVLLGPGFSTAANGTFSAYIQADCKSLLTVPSINLNYIITYTPQVAGLTNYASTSNTSCQVMAGIRYFDGLGRLIQTVEAGGSPAGNDLIEPVAYDAMGRHVFNYLPYTTSIGPPGSFRSNALTANSGLSFFYQQTGQGYIPTPYPYAQVNLESSPLNRPLEQGYAGQAWQLSTSGVTGGGHTDKLNYLFNNTVTWSSNPTTSMDVILYTATVNSDGSRTLVNNGTYYANLLSVKVIEDENWVSGRAGTTEEYRDQLNRVVLKRAYNSVSGTLQQFSTYYVYDNDNQLAFVLPPVANPDVPSGVTQTVLNNLCYQYQYDARDRMSAKELPGKGWEYMVYNNADQLAATQDANQRANNQWTITKYDALGRVIIEGLWNNGNTAITPANLEAAIYAAPQWDTPNPASSTGYNIVSYPQTLNSILTINYYDNYTNIPNLPAAYANASASKMTEGLLTASLTTVIDPADAYTNALWTVNYYDDLGRLTNVYKQHYLGGGTANVNNYDYITNTYNFNNQVTSTTHKHYNTSSTTSPLVTIANTYVYDHTAKRVQNFEQLTNGTGTPGPNILIAQENYNEIDQLGSKSLHSTDGINFYQNINYGYNERGWMLSNAAALFQEILMYNSNTANITGIYPTPQYNGNIAVQSWQSNTATTYSNFVYQYDPLNRLLSGATPGGVNIERGISYDAAGNIATLSRVFSGTLIDSLSFNYTNGGNYTDQLQSATDASGNTASNGYPYGTFTYAYDANGNMVTDNSKGITGATGITYNILNLPQAISAKGVTYTYSADGEKLRRAVTSGSATTYTDYIDGIEYDGSAGAETVTFIQTEEGRALPTGSAYNYEYNLADHLGDTRITFDTETGVARVQQQDDYMPFGMDISTPPVGSPQNYYLYNKKEWQTSLGLYDYGARFYDPVIGRFGTVDPEEEDGEDYTLYAYVKNNPISNVDIDGRDDYYYDAKGNLSYIVQQEGDDRFYQSDANGINSQIGYGDLTGSMANTYAVESQFLQAGIIQFDGGVYSVQNNTHDDLSADQVNLIMSASDPFNGRPRGKNAFAPGGEAIESPIIDPIDFVAGGLTAGYKGLAAAFLKDAEVETTLTVEAIMANPNILEGKTLEEVQQALAKSGGDWEVTTMSKSTKAEGWVLREKNAAGNLTGRRIQYHPGTPRHPELGAYWKVSGTPQVAAQRFSAGK